MPDGVVSPLVAYLLTQGTLGLGCLVLGLAVYLQKQELKAKDARNDEQADQHREEIKALNEARVTEMREGMRAIAKLGDTLEAAMSMLRGRATT